MPDPQTPDGRSCESDLRQIPLWADRYARHRVLAVLVALAIITLAAALIGGLSAGAGVAWQRGMPGLGIALAIADAAFCVFWVWLVLSRRLNLLVEGANRRLYRNEGEVAPSGQAVRPMPADKIVAWTFGAPVCSTPIILQAVDLPTRYLQPITAAYTVPLMVYITVRQSALSTRLMLLWPGLYAAHALLVLAGVPLFANIDPMMAVLLPMTGYGLVAVLVAHLYSRYALRRLRSLSHISSGADGGEADGDR